MPTIAEKIEQAAVAVAAESAAASLPLPGPAGDAFACGPIVVGKWSVRKIVAYDWRVWQMTDNALVRGLAALGKTEDGKGSDMDESESVAIWCLINPPAEVREALKAGVEAFKVKCVEEIEFELELPEFSALTAAVLEQVKRSSATVARYAQQATGEESGSTFFPAAGGAA